MATATTAGVTGTETLTTPANTAEGSRTGSLTETGTETAGETGLPSGRHHLLTANGSLRDEALEAGVEEAAVVAAAVAVVAAAALEKRTIRKFHTSPKSGVLGSGQSTPARRERSTTTTV